MGQQYIYHILAAPAIENRSVSPVGVLVQILATTGFLPPSQGTIINHPLNISSKTKQDLRYQTDLDFASRPAEKLYFLSFSSTGTHRLEDSQNTAGS